MTQTAGPPVLARPEARSTADGVDKLVQSCF